MKKATRLIGLILALLMILTLTVGCGNRSTRVWDDEETEKETSERRSRREESRSDSDGMGSLWDRSGSNSGEEPVEEPERPAEEVPVEEPARPAEEVPVEETARPAEEVPVENIDPKSVTVEQQLLCELDGVKITVTGMEADSYSGPDFYIKIENTRSDKVIVQANSCVVNGYVIDCIMSSTVEPGQTLDDYFSFWESDLELAGISVISELELKFQLVNPEDWSTMSVSEPVVLKTSARGYRQTYDESGTVVYNADGIKVICKGTRDGGWSGPGVTFYVYNGSSHDISVMCQDVVVNGKEIDGLLYAGVPAGLREVTSMTFWSSDLEEAGITSIEDVTMGLWILNTENWKTIAEVGGISLSF